MTNFDRNNLTVAGMCSIVNGILVLVFGITIWGMTATVPFFSSLTFKVMIIPELILFLGGWTLIRVANK